MICNSHNVFAQRTFEVTERIGAYNRQHAIDVRHGNRDPDRVGVLAAPNVPDVRSERLRANRSRVPRLANRLLPAYFNGLGR